MQVTRGRVPPHCTGTMFSAHHVPASNWLQYVRTAVGIAFRNFRITVDLPTTSAGNTSISRNHTAARVSSVSCSSTIPAARMSFSMTPCLPSGCNRTDSFASFQVHSLPFSNHGHVATLERSKSASHCNLVHGTCQHLQDGICRWSRDVPFCNHTRFRRFRAIFLRVSALLPNFFFTRIARGSAFTFWAPYVGADTLRPPCSAEL